MKQLFENAWMQYLITGATALVILMLLLYVAPLVVVGAILISIFVAFSLALGFIVVESSKNWKSWNK